MAPNRVGVPKTMASAQSASASVGASYRSFMAAAFSGQPGAWRLAPGASVAEHETGEDDQDRNQQTLAYWR